MAITLHKDLTGTDLHPPGAHKTQHENGGADELSVAGLSGTLADPQPTTIAQITDATAAGKALLDDADAAAQRATLGLGTLATASSLALDALSDVNAPSPSDGDRLTWDAGSSSWVSSAASAGYSDEQAQDAVGNILDDSGDIDFTYDDATPKITALVKARSVTWAKVQAMTTGKLLGRTTASSGDVEEISIGTGLSLSGGTLSATGGSGGSTPAADDLLAKWAVPGSPNAMDDEFDGSSSATWTDINTPTYSTVHNSLLFTVAAADAKKLRVQTAPSTPYTAVCALTYYAASGANGTPGMWFRQSSTGKLYVMGYNTVGDVSVNHYSGPGSGTFVGTDIGAVGSKCNARHIWMAVTDNGTNLRFWYSPDGVRWLELGSGVARGGYMTGGPDQVGIGTNGVDAAHDVRFHHFRVTASATP
jgi:hypothetical protein